MPTEEAQRIPREVLAPAPSIGDCPRCLYSPNFRQGQSSRKLPSSLLLLSDLLGEEEGKLSHKDMWEGCIVSSTTSARSSQSCSRSVWSLSLLPNTARVFAASYFLR